MPFGFWRWSEKLFGHATGADVPAVVVRLGRFADCNAGAACRMNEVKCAVFAVDIDNYAYMTYNFFAAAAASEKYEVTGTKVGIVYGCALCIL